MTESMARVSDPEWGSACAERCLPSFFDGLESRLNSPLLERAMSLLRENPEAYVSVEQWADEVMAPTTPNRQVQLVQERVVLDSLRERLSIFGIEYL